MLGFSRVWQYPYLVHVTIHEKPTHLDHPPIWIGSVSIMFEIYCYPCKKLNTANDHITR